MKKIFLVPYSLLYVLVILSASEGFSQNVGIGTTLPTGKLQVNHRSTSLHPSIVIFDSSTSSAGKIKFLNAGGNRFWQINALVNNAIPSGHYMDIVTDSLWIMTLRGNGNVGINNSAPAYKLDVIGDGNINGILRVSDRLGLGVTSPTEKLDVNGNINLNGVLKINGSAGTAGQVFTSNGTGDPQWKNAAYSNNSRFAADIPLLSGTGDLTYSTIYNLNPADVTISGSTLTINKSGLWHFEGHLYVNISWSAPPLAQAISAGLTVDGISHTIIRRGILDRDPMVFSSADFVKTLHFSIDVYVSAPATVRVSRSIELSAGGSTYLSRYADGLITGYLINE